ncbi:hypothetical protein CA13_04430 [Planctomycetes bacterium CA13]|uniref:TssC1 N-terminal domain-containing protein n=1 Tax=Novipirellula herctigrandis TaxID=2527986 RepID=A0A5C5YW97_9BACT|nr:hypothetical protein CA13_04430 [Planctomycetes bacterium CA13]
MPVEPNPLFRIAVLGDFSGRQNRGVHEIGDALARRRPLSIDRDNLEDCMERLGVELDHTIEMPDQDPISLRFCNLDDFHPDTLFNELDMFASLRSLRRRLLKADTFDQAATEVLGWGVQINSADTTQKPSPPTDESSKPVVVDGADAISQILGESSQSKSVVSKAYDWNRLVDEIVAPYREAKSDPRQPELVRCVDQAIQTTMQALIKHPSFRELESAWLAMKQLVYGLETDAQLKIYLIDISKQELAEDLESNEKLRSTGIYRLLVERSVETPGGEPWSLILGNYRYGLTTGDAVALSKMAAVAKAAGAAYVAGASSNFFGTPNTNQSSEQESASREATNQWQTLREMPASSHVGLVWPRFTLRLPYGANTRSIESFDFEEMSDDSNPRELLWGNSAFLVAMLLGQSFGQSGSALTPGEIHTVGDLPVWIYREQGESVAHPCAECLLTDEMIDAVKSFGVMPCVSFRNRDQVQIRGWCSINGGPLSGRW